MMSQSVILKPSFWKTSPVFSGENRDTDYEKAIYLARDSVFVGHLGTLFMKH